MYCENCGEKLESENAVCKNCNKENSNNLLIKRKKSFAGCAINIHIDVDNTHYELGNGGEVRVNLSNGEHIIKYKVWNRREKTVTLNVVNDKNYQIIFKYDALWGGFKLDKNSVIE